MGNGEWGIIRFLFRAVLFRAAHDQRFAAGPRQGHFVLDPEKCKRIFRLRGVKIWWALPGSNQRPGDYESPALTD